MLGVDFGGFGGCFYVVFWMDFQMFSRWFLKEISREFARPKTSGHLQEDSKTPANMGTRGGLLRYPYVVFMLFLRYPYVSLSTRGALLRYPYVILT